MKKKQPPSASTSTVSVEPSAGSPLEGFIGNLLEQHEGKPIKLMHDNPKIRRTSLLWEPKKEGSFKASQKQESRWGNASPSIPFPSRHTIEPPDDIFSLDEKSPSRWGEKPTEGRRDTSSPSPPSRNHDSIEKSRRFMSSTATKGTQSPSSGSRENENDISKCVKKPPCYQV